jgi:hypothetical protein
MLPGICVGAEAYEIARYVFGVKGGGHQDGPWVRMGVQAILPISVSTPSVLGGESSGSFHVIV